MTALLTNIFETHFRDKETEEKQHLYKSLVEASTFETYQFFTLFDKALDEIIGTDICTQLYSKLLENLKTNSSECETILFQKIVDKYTNKLLSLQMSATGWDVIKDNSSVCYKYFKLRNIKFQPTMQNIQILNSIRKHNIHICNNHAKHWLKTKKLNIYLSNRDQFMLENVNDLIKFFSKLSSSVIKSIITEQQNKQPTPQIYFPILCNMFLDHSDVDEIFNMYEMKEFVINEHIHNYFLHINPIVFEKYWEVMSNNIRPDHSIISTINKFFSDDINLTSIQIKTIIDFALFFHVKDKAPGMRTFTGKYTFKESYLNMISCSIPHFSIEQQLKLNPQYIDKFDLSDLCHMHFDPLVIYTINEICNVSTLCSALLMCNNEAFEHIDVLKAITNIFDEEHETEEVETMVLQIVTCVEVLNKEKQDLLFKQIIKFYRTISQQLLLKFDLIYKGELIKQLYHTCIIDRLKKYKLDVSLAQVDTNISSEDMLNVIFDKSEIEFGKCNICWDKTVEFTCKSCGNCSCGTCNRQLQRCAICKTSGNFLKLHM